jgi:Cu+-exporting ATPase
MKSRHESSKKDVKASTAKDPVCGMEVDTAKPGAHLRIDGKDQYFCGSDCRNQFKKQQAEPSKGARQHA